MANGIPTHYKDAYIYSYFPHAVTLYNSLSVFCCCCCGLRNLVVSSLQLIGRIYPLGLFNQLFSYSFFGTPCFIVAFQPRSE